MLEFDYLRADLLLPVTADVLERHTYHWPDIVRIEPGTADFLVRLEITLTHDKNVRAYPVRIEQGSVAHNWLQHEWHGLGLPILGDSTTSIIFDPPPMCVVVVVRQLSDVLAGTDTLGPPTTRGKNAERELFRVGCRYWLGPFPCGVTREAADREYWTVASTSSIYTGEKEKCRVNFGHKYKYAQSRLVARTLTLPEAQRVGELVLKARSPGGTQLPPGYTYASGLLLVPVGGEIPADLWLAELVRTQACDIPAYKRSTDRFPKVPPAWHPHFVRSGVEESRGEIAQRLQRQVELVLKARIPEVPPPPSATASARSAAHPVVLAARRRAQYLASAPTVLSAPQTVTAHPALSQPKGPKTTKPSLPRGVPLIPAGPRVNHGRIKSRVPMVPDRVWTERQPPPMPRVPYFNRMPPSRPRPPIKRLLAARRQAHRHVSNRMTTAKRLIRTVRLGARQVARDLRTPIYLHTRRPIPTLPLPSLRYPTTGKK